MEQINLITVLSLVVGVLVGGGVAALVLRRGKPTVAAAAAAPQKAYTDDTQWLLKKQDLSGSQRQILEFIESSARTSIQAVQDRFTKVPDRELFYRLEQLHLVGFIDKERDGDEVIYSLSDAYKSAVQVPADDKTVMIPRQ